MNSLSFLRRRLSSTPSHLPLLSRRFFHSDGNFGDSNPFESAETFEERLFGSSPKNSAAGDGGGGMNDSFFRKLDRAKRRTPPSGGFGPGPRSRGNDGAMMEGYDTLEDGMEDKLKKAATTFQVSDGIFNDDYKFRPDATFIPGSPYKPRDRDPPKPGTQSGFKRSEFRTTTAEVLKKADFRNVRFLSNFLTESGIMLKRSHTKISAKAQRKVAREIKTARAFGLIPFTTMGTKPFIFGKSMEDVEVDYGYDTYQGSNLTDAAVEPDVEPELES